ncbi:hypothetical protein [Streptomyces flavofungini]|uniref:hypothetical protein n=1 Tax=Streptomyces flavofungini TaxID=68200 RepID=UPI0025AEDEA1|nr:hypothetical protein [Streptomyces flavofungini]WJV45814.1 hypothetical protein QUY26_09875 [Streptomyces flavofungini]
MIKLRVFRTRAFGRSVLCGVTGERGTARRGRVGRKRRLERHAVSFGRPDAVAQRLKSRSDEVYDVFALPQKYAADSGNVDTGACYYRGLKGAAHIDEARSDVRSFGLDRSVPDVSEATARDAQRRVRQNLARKGWKLTRQGDRTSPKFRELGFRFENPDSGDQVDARWNDSTTTLFVSVYAPCGQVPGKFMKHDWPEADWYPKERSTEP